MSDSWLLLSLGFQAFFVRPGWLRLRGEMEGFLWFRWDSCPTDLPSLSLTHLKKATNETVLCMNARRCLMQ